MLRRGDHLNQDFTGLGSGDMKRINVARSSRHTNDGDDDSPALEIFDKLMEYGSNAVLL